MKKARKTIRLSLLGALFCLFQIIPLCFADTEVRCYEGIVEVPTYEFTGRETQPPLFQNSTVGGKYPFPPYIRPLKSDGPNPRKYKAVFLENQYLKLTYLPEFGGRFYSLYDKVAGRELFYENDVIKPAGYNAKSSFALFGIELTGPYDTHALTLYGEPFWFHKAISHEDGSMSLVLGNIDPVYRMKVNFSGRLYPGIAALQVSVSCYNSRQSQQPYMFWVSGSMRSFEKTRFIYPMTRTIGHTTSEVADWPFYGDVDYSWDRNNKHMLGVFGIDIYDNFQGAYHHDQDYGVFRFADRRVVQGMKMWTFGYSERATNLERAYTDNGGPYIEVQSGRHVWDGHYEWLAPHKWEGWSEWWFPVSGIGGLTTTSRDVALKLEVSDDPSEVRLGLSSNGVFPGASVRVSSRLGLLLDIETDLRPGTPFRRNIKTDPGQRELRVTVTDSAGRELLSYMHPDQNPGRVEYTPFTRALEDPRKPIEEMTVEELVLEAVFLLKQMNMSSGMALLKRAIDLDPSNADARFLLGVRAYEEGHFGEAVDHLERAINRDPYLEEAYYYLSLCQNRLEAFEKAERYLYFISPGSSYYANREYSLAQIALSRGDDDVAADHLRGAIGADGRHLSARFQLSLLYREKGQPDKALEQIGRIEELDPTNRLIAAEKYFLTGGEEPGRELLRLMGGQSQEALEVSWNYARIARWREAVEILRMAETGNSDPWGTPSVFYYTMAYFLGKLGDSDEVLDYLGEARSAAGNVDRFPFREETERPLLQAIAEDPKDPVAHFYLGCLLYHSGRSVEATAHWEKAAALDPQDFRSLRALGLAYAELGDDVERSSEKLERAIQVDPTHVRTFNDLSTIYARAGRFDRQVDLLTRALERSPGDDNLVEGLIAANLIMGDYNQAEEWIRNHRFQPRHRTYHLRDKFRFLRYGQGTRAFNRGDYQEALEQFRTALTPPVSLGMDDFQFESTPRVSYYIGRALESLGQREEAKEAYEKGLFGLEYLSGDRDSWNSENFHMVLSLERLDRKEEALKLVEQFEAFAESQLEGRNPRYRSEARYLLGLVKKYQRRIDEAGELLKEALQIQPDLLAPRLELRGDTLDPISGLH